MRRLLAIVLLCFFSLQSAWAVAAAYCAHEKASPDAVHFGHHAHDHDADAAQSAAADDDSSGSSVDLDCHVCHGCAHGLAPDALAHADGLPHAFGRPGHERHLPPPALAAPERPDWQRLA